MIIRNMQNEIKNDYLQLTTTKNDHEKTMQEKLIVFRDSLMRKMKNMQKGIAAI